MSDYSAQSYSQRFVPQSVVEAGENDGHRAAVELVLTKIDLDDPAVGAVTSVLSDMVKAGIEVNEQTVDTAIKLARLATAPSPAEQIRTTRALGGLPMYGPGADRNSIVYYVQRGSLIKIGTTSQPKKRFRDLVPDAILAFEPGDYKIEAARHRQFQSLRRGREYFEPRALLLAHIKRVRSQHGDPDPKWITTATIGQTVADLAEPLARPESGETLTAIEISRRLGISRNTVRAWAHRGQLLPVAGGTKRRPLYFLDQARELAERSRAWISKRTPQQAAQEAIF